MPSSRASATRQAAVKMTDFRKSEPSAVIDVLGNDLCRTIARETGLSRPVAITGTMQTKLLSIQTVCNKLVEFILVRGMISGHCAFNIRSSAARLECWIFPTNHRGSRNHVVLRNLWATIQMLLAASLLLRCRKCRHMRLVGSCFPQLVSDLFWDHHGLNIRGGPQLLRKACSSIYSKQRRDSPKAPAWQLPIAGLGFSWHTSAVQC